MLSKYEDLHPAKLLIHFHGKLCQEENPQTCMVHTLLVHLAHSLLFCEALYYTGIYPKHCSLNLLIIHHIPAEQYTWDKNELTWNDS